MKTSRREWIIRVASPPLLAIAPSACGVLGGNNEQTPKETLMLDISISAAADANIDNHERGAPIWLRIYELASPVGFLEADYFALQDREKITLGSDLLSVDAFMLRPGEHRSIRRAAKAGGTTIGVFAGYRDLPRAVWRAAHTLPAAVDAHWYRKTPRLRLAVAVQARGLLMTDTDAPPRAVNPPETSGVPTGPATPPPAQPTLPQPEALPSPEDLKR